MSEPGSSQQLETIKRETWTGNSTMVVNGAGSGTLTGKFGTHDIRIIHSQERSATGPVFEYTLYLAVDSTSLFTPTTAPTTAPLPDPLVEK